MAGPHARNRGVKPLNTQGGNQMADVITSQPESVAVTAAPAWATEIRKYAVEAIGAFFLTFVVVVPCAAPGAPSRPGHRRGGGGGGRGGPPGPPPPPHARRAERA